MYSTFGKQPAYLLLWSKAKIVHALFFSPLLYSRLRTSIQSDHFLFFSLFLFFCVKSAQEKNSFHFFIRTTERQADYLVSIQQLKKRKEENDLFSLRCSLFCRLHMSDKHNTRLYRVHKVLTVHISIAIGHFSKVENHLCASSDNHRFSKK